MASTQMEDTEAGKESDEMMAPIARHKPPSYKSAGKLQEGATAACTCVSGLEGKDAEDTLNLLKEAKTDGAQDPLKIPVALGYDVNRKKVIDAMIKKPVSLPLKSLNHISRNCRDLNASVHFYEHVLGFTPIKRPGSFNFDGSWLFNYGISIHLLQAEENELGSLPVKKEEINPRDDHISFQCEDLLLVEASLKGNGLKYTSRVIEEGGIMVEQIFFHDPDGFMIEVCTCDKLPVQPLQPAPLSAPLPAPLPAPLVRYPSRKRLATSSSTASFSHQMLQAEPLQSERRSIEQFAVSA